MKCPKCGYLGFEPVERCRNCGYEFSLIPADDLPELSIREHDAPDAHPLEDLALVDAAMPPARPGPLSPQATSGFQRCIDSQTPTTDLLLFGAPSADDVPLITRASRPRPPLAVRRATPEIPRLRSLQLPAPLFDLETDDPPVEAEARAVRQPVRAGTEGSPSRDAEVAGYLARLAATAIDLAILAAVDVLVIYFTMQICGLGLTDLEILPKGPLIAFLLVQNGGYLVIFTAGGQTLGKVAADIRVVSERPDSSLDLGRSMLRTLVWVLLAVPAGLGFLSAVFSADRRGLHDRCAGTRVIRASI
jgi:uncharacterized RDD family membrane protein YckC